VAKLLNSPRNDYQFAALVNITSGGFAWNVVVDYLQKQGLKRNLAGLINGRSFFLPIY